jgi:hypothetical protein
MDLPEGGGVMRRYDRTVSGRRAVSYAAGRYGRHELDGDARRASILLTGLFLDKMRCFDMLSIGAHREP